MKFALATGALISALFATKTALADLPRDGAKIRTNDYSIDLFQGPVLASTRVIGLAGAFVAIAEGVDGATMNPAAPAVRNPYSNANFDHDLGFGLTFPSALSNSDFFNSGKYTELPKGQTFDFLFLNLALNLQFGSWGFGAAADLQRYALRRSQNLDLEIERDELVAEIAVSHLQVAHAFADGQLVLGAGLRSTVLSVVNATVSATEQDLFSTEGLGYEAGLLWRPNWYQFRLGAAFRSAVTTQATPDSRMVLYENDPEDLLYLPDRVTLPWDLNIGVAVQLGARPFNPKWVNPRERLERVRRYLRYRARERERRRNFAYARAKALGNNAEAAKRAIDAELSAEAALDEAHEIRAEELVHEQIVQRYRSMKRFHILISASALITGAVEDAVGVESFLERTVQRSGRSASYSPRIGVETETIPHYLRLRAGMYIEPTRFESNRAGPRVHGTLGLDQKLFPWEVFGTFPEGTEWRVSGSLDAARSYLGWSVAVGVWH